MEINAFGFNLEGSVHVCADNPKDVRWFAFYDQQVSVGSPDGMQNLLYWRIPSGLKAKIHGL